jgi:hypothetical protein
MAVAQSSLELDAVKAANQAFYAALLRHSTRFLNSE